MSYSTGTILHGTNTKIGNLWMVYDGPLSQIALLWDGRNNLVCDHFRSTKHDIAQSSMKECTLRDALLIMNITYASMPLWASDLISSAQPITLPNSLATGSSNKPVQLTPHVLRKVRKALGIEGDDVKPEPKLSDTGCPGTSGGLHEYVAYTGLNQSFDFCKHCDTKRYGIK
jgi:hypothetical protein